MRLLPPEGFSERNESKSRLGRIFSDLPAVPQHLGWQPASLIHSKSGFPSHGAHSRSAAGLRGLPHQQQLQHHHHGLRQLPPERITRGHQTRTTCWDFSRPRASSATTPCVDRWQVRSHDHRLSLTAHADPPRHCTDCHINNNYNITDHGLRELPSAELSGRQKPGPRRRETSRRPVSSAIRRSPGERDIRSQQGGLPADECARRSAAVMRGLPHQQQLQHDDHGLRVVSPEGLTRHHVRNHVAVGFRACESCHDTVDLAEREVQPRSTGFPLTNSTRCRLVLRGLPHQQQLQLKHYVVLLVSPEGLHQHNDAYPCHRWASRRPASCATTPRSGPTASSITTRQPSL